MVKKVTVEPNRPAMSGKEKFFDGGHDAHAATTPDAGRSVPSRAPFPLRSLRASDQDPGGEDEQPTHHHLEDGGD